METGKVIRLVQPTRTQGLRAVHGIQGDAYAIQAYPGAVALLGDQAEFWYTPEQAEEVARHLIDCAAAARKAT